MTKYIEPKKNEDNFSKEQENTLEWFTKYEEVINFPRKYGSNDIYELNLEIRCIKNEFDAALKRIEEIDYDILDTVDRNDYDKLSKNVSALSNLHENLIGSLKRLENEISQSKDEYNQVIKECEKIQFNFEKIKRSSTPRPSWKNVGTITDGGEERWEKISCNKSSAELVNVILNEFLGTYKSDDLISVNLNNLPPKIPSPKYFFVSFNSLENKLVAVKNRRLNRQELTSCIKEVWDAKLANNAEKESNEKMSSYVFKYFKNKFHSNELALEWTVNLKEACMRFSKNESACFLLDVLNSNIDEAFTYTFYSLLKNLKTNFRNIIKSGITYDQAKMALIKTFPLKNLDQIKNLMHSLSGEFKEGKINVESFFHEAKDGKLGSFLSCLKEQFDIEKMKYIKLLSDNVKIDSNQINVYDFIDCVLKIDPNINENDLRKYIDWVFDGKKSKYFLIDQEDFCKKLKNGNFYQHF